MSESLPRPRRRIRDRLQEGQGLVEYGLILVLIGVIASLMLLAVGHMVNNVFSNISSSLGT